MRKIEDYKYAAIALIEQIAIFNAFARQHEKIVNEYKNNFHLNIEKIDKKIHIEIHHNLYEEVTIEEDHIEGIFESEYDLKSLFAEEFTSLQADALFIVYYGNFEHRLSEFVSIYADKLNINLSKRQKNESLLCSLFRNLLELKIDLTSCDRTNEAKNELDNEIRLIRNCLAHNGGSTSHIKTRNIAEKNNQLSITNEKIAVSYGYIFSTLESMSKIAHFIQSKIK